MSPGEHHLYGNEFVWVDAYEDIREWDAPITNAWLIAFHHWEPIENYDQTVFTNNWRTNPEWVAPTNFVWDITNNQWVMIDNVAHQSYKGWRSDQNDARCVIIHYMKHVKYGELVWNSEFRNGEWVWQPKQKIDILDVPEEEEEEMVDRCPTIPGVNDDILKKFDICIGNQTPHPEKPVLGNLTIMGNLFVNGTIQSGDGEGIITTDFTHVDGFPFTLSIVNC